MSGPQRQDKLSIRGDRLFDGTGVDSSSGTTVFVSGSRITEIGTEISTRPDWDFPGCTVLPGLIDVHAHLTLPGDGRTYEQIAATHSDEMMAIRAVHNATVHLRSGVTTVRDNGGRNRVTFSVRDAMNSGFFLGPQLLLAGRPVTPTGGHFDWCNGVADGVDDVRAAVRLLVKEGADHIKLMATGGGTATTDPTRASYTVEELRAGVDAAHDLGRLTTAHCRATVGMSRAIKAGLDCMEHAEFLSEEGTIRYEPSVADEMAESGIWISPTLLAGGHQLIFTLEAAAETRTLTAEEEGTLRRLEDHLESRLECFGRLLELGLGSRMVAGTDAGPGYTEFGSMALHMELMVRGGMTPLQSLLSGTRLAADACAALDAGTLEIGKAADILVVKGDPVADIRALRDVVAVFKAGTPAYIDELYQRPDARSPIRARSADPLT